MVYDCGQQVRDLEEKLRISQQTLSQVANQKETLQHKLQTAQNSVKEQEQLVRIKEKEFKNLKLDLQHFKDSKDKRQIAELKAEIEGLMKKQLQDQLRFSQLDDKATLLAQELERSKIYQKENATLTRQTETQHQQLTELRQKIRTLEITNMQ